MADIRHSIQTTAKRETIHPLVATAKGFAKWWATDLTESAGVVELGFFNRATESDYFVSCNTTWGELMFRLKAVAEGKSARPQFRTADMAD